MIHSSIAWSDCNAMKRPAGALAATQAAGYCFHFARSFAPSSSLSWAVIEFPRIEPPLGLDQGNQQHLIGIAFGSPSEARDLLGSP